MTEYFNDELEAFPFDADTNVVEYRTDMKGPEVFALKFQHVDALIQAVDPTFPPATSCRIVDVGCGLGGLTSWLAGVKAAAGNEVTPATIVGYDLAPRVARAKEEHPELAEHFVVVSGTDMPFEDETFDIIFFHNTFHHMPDQVASLHEVKRVLRPGGFAVMLEPYTVADPDCMMRLVRYFLDEREVWAEAYRNVTSAPVEGLESCENQIKMVFQQPIARIKSVLRERGDEVFAEKWPPAQLFVDALAEFMGMAEEDIRLVYHGRMNIVRKVS